VRHGLAFLLLGLLGLGIAAAVLMRVRKGRRRDSSLMVDLFAKRDP
jgi:hypothetical protein